MQQYFKGMGRRIGQIKISRDFISDIYKTENSDLFAVFAQFIPIYIEDNPVYNYKIYYGISNEFDEILEGEVPPLYDVILTVCEDKNIK